MDGIEWKQYEPPAVGEMVKKPGKGHNSSSISVYVRSIMAREWARALGKKPVQRKPSPLRLCSGQAQSSTDPGRGEKDGLYGSR